jgi:hypothetical protein
MLRHGQLSHGWVDSRRVPIVDGRSDLSDGSDLSEVPVRIPCGPWPSAEMRLTSLEYLTASEAGELAEYARCRFVEWLCGGGLSPVALGYRWTLAVRELSLATGAGLCDRTWMRAHEAGEGSRAWRTSVWREIYGNALDRWRAGERKSEAGLSYAGRKGRLPELSGSMRSMPLAEVMAWCGNEGLEVPTGVPVADFLEEAGWLARLAARQQCGWLAESGSGLLPVVQRIYGLIFWRHKEIAGDLAGPDFSSFVGQGRAAFCELTKRLFEEPGEVLLGYRPKTAGQKSADSSAVYAANAASHCPRRQLDCAAGLDGEAEEARADLEDELAEAASEEARAMAADWARARRYVDYLGEDDRGPELKTERQREYARILIERDAAEFLAKVNR